MKGLRKRDTKIQDKYLVQVSQSSRIDGRDNSFFFNILRTDS